MDNGKRCLKQKGIVYSLGERKIAFIGIFGALPLLSFPFAEDTFNYVWYLCLNSTEAGRVHRVAAQDVSEEKQLLSWEW